MVGGDAETVRYLDPIFATLAPGAGSIPPTPGREKRDARVSRGYMHCGPAGAGHFVKMIHNGIEYGLMQAYAEGFDILRGRSSPELPADERFDLDVADIAEVWRRGSVVSSWLLDLCAIALARDPALSEFTGSVARFRRRTLDGRRRDGRSGAGRRAGDLGLRQVPLAQGTHLRGKTALRHAPAVRRPRREEVAIRKAADAAA